MPGWTPVSNETRYSKERGFGWGPAGGTPWDGAARDTTFGPALIRNFCEAGGYNFHVDVPPGRYRVMVIYENSGYWGGEQAHAPRAPHPRQRPRGVEREAPRRPRARALPLRGGGAGRRGHLGHVHGRGAGPAGALRGGSGGGRDHVPLRGRPRLGQQGLGAGAPRRRRREVRAVAARSARRARPRIPQHGRLPRPARGRVRCPAGLGEAGLRGVAGADRGRGDAELDARRQAWRQARGAEKPWPKSR